MLLVIALGLLSVVLVALASRPASRPAPVRLVEADRADDRERVNPAVPISQHCGYAPSGPTRDRSSW